MTEGGYTAYKGDRLDMLSTAVSYNTGFNKI